MAYLMERVNMGGNNLKIDINKDFLKEYKDNFFKGFSVSEVIHLVAALGVAALIMFVVVRYFHIDIVAAVYISVPFIIPIVFSGIYKYQDYLKPKDYMLERQYTLASERLHYETEEAENAVDYLCKLYKITISNETRKKIDTIENAKCIITAIAALRTSVAVNEAAAAKDLPESVSTAIFNLYTSNDELHKKINEASDTVNNLKNSNDDIRQIFETEIKNSFEREKQATNALIEQYRVSLEAKDKTYTLIMRSNNDLKKENEKLKGEMNTLQIENDKLKAMNALQAGTAQNQQPAAQQTINQNNGNKGISLFTKMKNHRNKNQQNNHNMDIFISDILSNNKFTKEQKDYLMSCIESGADYEFVKKIAVRELDVDMMKRIVNYYNCKK